MDKPVTPPPKLLPVVGRDFKLPDPPEGVLPEVRERFAWYNLSPEERYRLANETWHRWNKLRGHSVQLALQSLHRRFGRAE
ncbi:MAG: hypothetical protein FJ279_01050 [Planctomycetes bacterium]|nr:hypothetical protein [Planctomycetota bacterium]MBM4081537.1 hypothetical protein [Planctomycetota bacterium]MBM4086293.1 hypothetical protein [Planctomycetota bacterium]